MRCTIVALLGLVVGCSGGDADRRSSTAATPVKQGSRIELVYEIDLDAAIDSKAREVKLDLQAGLADAMTSASVLTPVHPLGAIAVTVEPSQRAEVAKLIESDYGDALESRMCDVTEGPKAICYRISASHGESVKAAALRDAVTTIQRRLKAGGIADAAVAPRGAEKIVVELPALDEDRIATARALIVRSGRLEMKVVDDGSPYMMSLFRHVGSERSTGAPTDPAAVAAGIRAEVDHWRPEDGSSHTDYYLMAYDREEQVTVEEARRLGCWDPRAPSSAGTVPCRISGRSAIDRYVRELQQRDPVFLMPSDRQLGFEWIDDPNKRPYWRSYYLNREPRLTQRAIKKAAKAIDPISNHAIVMLDLNTQGARTFGALTAATVGKKIATLLDGTVKSAPIINGAIRGGRAWITMGGSDPKRQERDASELAMILEVGALPATLREVSATPKP